MLLTEYYDKTVCVYLAFASVLWPIVSHRKLLSKTALGENVTVHTSFNTRQHIKTCVMYLLANSSPSLSDPESLIPKNR